MKNVFRTAGALLAALMFVTPAFAQMGSSTTSQAPAAQSAQARNTDVYHINVFRAVPGKIRELRELLTAAPPAGEAQDFFILLRHEEGNEWDFMAITHAGPAATVKAPAGQPAPPPASSPSRPTFDSVVAWHGDTFAAGPSLEEFRRNLKIGDRAAQAQDSTARGRKIYIVSDYMAVPGQRAQLRQVLDRIATERPNRSVTLTHLEGAPWIFLTIQQYDSWTELAQVQEGGPPAASGTTPGAASGQAQTAPPTEDDIGMELRKYMTVHHDTIAHIAFVGEPSAAKK